jgi:hypothetical protein
MLTVFLRLLNVRPGKKCNMTAAEVLRKGLLVACYIRSEEFNYFGTFTV